MAFVPIVGSTDFINRVLKLEDDVLHHQTRRLTTTEDNNIFYLTRAVHLDSYNMLDLHIDRNIHLSQLPGVFDVLSSVVRKLKRQRTRFDNREMYRGFIVGRDTGDLIKKIADKARRGRERVFDRDTGKWKRQRKQKLAESSLIHISSYL